MTPRLSLPINEILVEDRQRIDYGDLSELAESIRLNGLIQPIIINQTRRLIDGGRRLEACKTLGHERIDIVFRETMSQDELFVLELEANIRRKDETWQEMCLHISKIHYLKKQIKAADCESWGERETGAMLGVSKGHINSVLVIARKLKHELSFPPETTRKYWACDSLMEAVRLKLRDDQDENLAELAKRHQEAANRQESFRFEQIQVSTQEGEGSSSPSYDPLEEARQQYYTNPLNPPGSFESYWAERQRLFSQDKIINLSNRLIQGDSIAFMHANPNRFDHIITDIPYGIDMDHLNQTVPMKDLDTIEKEHDVEYNLKLISDFFPAAFKTTKEKAFVITWADQMCWQYMYDCAIKAGFSVQRWPITWFKTHQCKNQCVSFNFTKDTEIAIVCRKPSTTLVKQPQTSVVSESKDELCESIGHPFAKPFGVWKFLVEATTLENQSILEPFAGRGSGVISMLRLNRCPVGVELQTEHYNALLENVKTLHYLKLDSEFKFV